MQYYTLLGTTLVANEIPHTLQEKRAIVASAKTAIICRLLHHIF